MMKSAPRRGWLRSREQSVVFAVGFGSFGAVALGESLIGQSSFPLIGWLAMAVFVISGVRLALMGVRPNQSGVTVRNPLKTYEVPWADIHAFRVGSYRLLRRVALMDLLSGATIPIIGIAGAPPATRPNNQTAEILVDELNELLGDSRERSLPR
jgi:hypothetical protein